MKAFLGNFYRHLAIFTGHTAQNAQNRKSTFSGFRNNRSERREGRHIDLGRRAEQVDPELLPREWRPELEKTY